MKTKILVGLYLLVALVACNKEPNENNPVFQEPNYFPMTTGSYWVYNTYEIDSLKNEELVSENDTTSIIGDTILNGNSYKISYEKLYATGSKKYNHYWRDSLGYIVNEEGTILFSQNNFSDTLSSIVIKNAGTATDTLFYMYSMMKHYTNEKILPAGVFDSIQNYNVKFVYWTEPDRLTSSMDNLYAPNVGNIVKQYHYAGQYHRNKSYYEERLIGYFIAE